MKYDIENDTYTCHNTKLLKAKGIINSSSATGYKSVITVYECEDCTSFSFKEKCTKAVGNRKMQVSKNFIEKRETSYQNIKT